MPIIDVENTEGDPLTREEVNGWIVERYGSEFPRGWLATALELGPDFDEDELPDITPDAAEPIDPERIKMLRRYHKLADDTLLAEMSGELVTPPIFDRTEENPRVHNLLRWTEDLPGGSSTELHTKTDVARAGATIDETATRISWLLKQRPLWFVLIAMGVSANVYDNAGVSSSQPKRTYGTNPAQTVDPSDCQDPANEPLQDPVNSAKFTQSYYESLAVCFPGIDFGPELTKGVWYLPLPQQQINEIQAVPGNLADILSSPFVALVALGPQETDVSVAGSDFTTWAPVISVWNRSGDSIPTVPIGDISDSRGSRTATEAAASRPEVKALQSMVTKAKADGFNSLQFNGSGSTPESALLIRQVGIGPLGSEVPSLRPSAVNVSSERALVPPGGLDVSKMQPGSLGEAQFQGGEVPVAILGGWDFQEDGTPVLNNWLGISATGKVLGFNGMDATGVTVNELVCASAGAVEQFGPSFDLSNCVAKLP